MPMCFGTSDSPCVTLNGSFTGAFQHEQRNVVAWRGAFAERSDGAKEPFEQFRRRELSAGAEARDDSVVAKLVPLRVHRFAHAIAEDYEEIAGLELNGLFLVLRLGKQAQHQSAGVEPLHAVLREEHWWVMAGVAERQSAGWRQDAVYHRHEPVSH